MSLRFRYAAIRVTTPEGVYGTEVTFDDGLTVLRADNSRGKSTLVQAMFYGLGLEGMFGPWHEPPLPHAVKDHLETPDGRQIPVLESQVLLEIENATGDGLSLRRQIVGEGDIRIIETWSGRVFTDQTSARVKRDYYVRFEGAAQRERGFHHFLEDFLGWRLPTVPRYQGEDGKLYLEAVLPLMYVEQKKGWSVVGADFPTYFRIKDVSARAIEFVLRLDATDLARQRNALDAKERQLREEWAEYLVRATKLAETLHGVVENLPSTPVPTWPPAVAPRVLFPTKEGGWVPVEEAIELAKTELDGLLRTEVPTAERASQEAATRLETAEAELTATERQGRNLAQAFESERAQLESVDQQLVALEEDLQRNRDLLRLRDLGSSEPWNIHPDMCPTCLQPMPDALVPLAAGETVMGVEEQIEFIRQQRQVFRAVRDQTERTVSTRKREIAAIDEAMLALRDEIRGLKLTLISDPRSPSFAAIQKQVAVTGRLEQLKTVQASFADELNSFEYVAAHWKDLQAAKRALPEGDLSSADVGKLERLQDLLVEALSDFELRSVPPAEVTISRDSYRPIYRGFDLQFDFSASDTIRTIWAYRLSLLELAREAETNHPGVLVFDEPRQHNTDATSIRAFFVRAADSQNGGQQVIVATSGEDALVSTLLADLPHRYMSFDEYLLEPVE